jgi:hypothetical protein
MARWSTASINMCWLAENNCADDHIEIERVLSAT